MKRSSSQASQGLHISFISFPKKNQAKISEIADEFIETINRIEERKKGNILLEKSYETRYWTEFALKIRAPNIIEIKKLTNDILTLAKEMAKRKDLLMQHRYFTKIYSDMIWNNNLSEAYKQNLIRLNDTPHVEINRPNVGDEGNVSHVVPTICTWIKTSDSRVPGHSREFAEISITEMGHESIVLGAKSLAMTVIDLCTNKDLVKKSLKEFSKVSPERSSEILLRYQLS
jgi:hypothetical protein